MRLGRLTSLEREALAERLGELEGIIAELRSSWGARRRSSGGARGAGGRSRDAFGDARRTVILEDGEEHEAPVEDPRGRGRGHHGEPPGLREAHPPAPLPAAGGAGSRSPGWRTSRRLAGADLHGPHPGWLLAFTEGGQGHFLSVLDIPESARASRGQSIYSLIQADREDRIVALVPVEDLLDEPERPSSS
jgi:DNA gyrase subunit A